MGTCTETYERLQREWADRTARGGSNTATNGIGNQQIPDDLNPWNHNLFDPATSNGTVNSGWNLGEQNRRLAEALGLTEPRRGGDGSGAASPSGSRGESPSGSLGYMGPWQELPPAKVPRVVLREVAVGLLNGVAFAAIMAVVVVVWFGVSKLGLVIGAAMIINLVAAALAGIFIPLALAHWRFDPAVSSTVFVTTVTDVVGFFAFLGLAALWLR